MRERVIVIGAGVGGLTAAHELVERGFDVHVCERRQYAGGKAASERVGKSRVPGEHGFRFFPGWYKHLPHTMGRVPYRGRRDRYQDATVLDNLVTIDSSLLAWYRRDAMTAPLHLPRTAGQAANALSFVERLQGLGLAIGEITFFVNKLLEFLLLSDAERIARLEPIAWWDYVEADTKSDAFRDLIAATTRTMVAAKATEASAYTIARLAVRTLFDAFTAVDRVLNGPTQEVWIQPWVDHLMSLGVEFHWGCELESLAFEPGKKKLASVTFSDVPSDDATRAARIIARIRKAASTLSEPFAPDDIDQRRERNTRLALANDCDALRRLRYREHLTPEISRALDACAACGANKGKPVELASLGLLKNIAPPKHTPSAPTVEAADYFVFALPVEQMAYFVNRSTMLKYHDPSLERIVELAGYTDWMSGIQYYLKIPLDLARGHIVCMESEWGLTAVEQTQFWRELEDVPSDVRAVLSVDVATWDRKGRFIQREAFNCSKDEVAVEVWEQLKASLNRKGQATSRLRDDMLRGQSKLKSVSDSESGNYHLDDSVTDVFDRKKQAAYEKARGVRPDRSQGVPPWSSPGDAPYVWGRRALYNAEPLLVCRSGARALRPEASTAIDNMFLAADYVLTETDLACMEGANEAARRAVNALLDRSGSREERCQVWRFTATDELVGRLRELMGLSSGLTTAFGAARALGKVAGGMWGVAGRLVTSNSRNRSKR